MTVDTKRRASARERQQKAIRQLVAHRNNPGRWTRPRGNPTAEPREIERGLEKLGRVIGH